MAPGAAGAPNAKGEGTEATKKANSQHAPSGRQNGEQKVPLKSALKSSQAAPPPQAAGATSSAVSATSKRKPAKSTTVSDKPLRFEWKYKEPSLDGLFPTAPGTYTLDDLKLAAIGVELPTKQELMALKSTKVRTVINGDLMKRPQAGCTASINYIAFYTNANFHGKMWDSTYNRGRPLQFQLGCNGVFEGLETAVMTMVEGAKALAFIPACEGFGSDQGFPSLVPPDAVLIFWIVLEEVLPLGYRSLRLKLRQYA
uniref:peptidylprolyl isomerase n=1 Tax=Chromera velia CCMP2878 TaxID=1169474 RepID=A0A0G4FA50_9ALVE|eukprot:Cvel_3009.t1-p1 / transcript=Cvel_3009.t1 / gene=Cvel_3009 / organism=Chromera_velia_CCMP2878 / gene_product=FK506-binding protein 1, putative / transcript_product=FK506-binding protein 1, putative / location=Cvel_scaffold120:17595-19548(+) / protein_length=255 / sequence_SO=supercontig / SO=protein_coding / is_pseudo=false